MAWQTPVYDRTLLDCKNKLEKARLLPAWLRIEANALYVQQLLTDLGYDTALGTQLNPTTSSKWYAAYVNTLANNIEILRKALLPSTEDIDYPDDISMTDYETLRGDFTGGAYEDTINYQTVNEWEKDLELLKIHTEGVPLYRLKSGTFRSGSNHVLQHFMRGVM